MRAHQIMTRKVIAVKPDTPVSEAANIMLQRHVSGLPVVDGAGKLVGIVSEGDFMRRSEIGTQGPRIRWLDFLMGAGKSALEFVREHGSEGRRDHDRTVASPRQKTCRLRNSCD